MYTHTFFSPAVHTVTRGQAKGACNEECCFAERKQCAKKSGLTTGERGMVLHVGAWEATTD